MRLILVMLFFLTMLFSEKFSEKLIVSADKNSTTIQLHLLKLKMLFIGNSKTRALQETYKLNLEIETLDTFTMVVIKPIKSLTVKNELLLLLSPHFPNIFLIEDRKAEMTDHGSMTKSKIMKTHTPPTHTNAMHKAKILLEKIGLEWITLLLLSILGLTLSLNRRMQMARLKSIQKELSQKQEKIENEIKNLGASRV